MTIATKNGRVILTPLGAAAETCSCCKKPCGSQSNSGGAGVTVENYDFPEEEGDVQFTYQAFSVRDRFIVYGDSQTFFDTGEPVSGGRTVSFYKPQGVTTISVRVEGPSGTAWNYTIGCPQVGACCNGTTCVVKPQSQCNAAAGEVFKGVGTVCEEGRCDPCFRFCQPSNITPPETIYLTISNYSAIWPFLAIGSLDGTYALSRDLGSADCQSYSTSLYPTDCQDVGQPAYCFSPCTHKIIMTVNQSNVQIIAFDRTDGFTSCVGFSMFRLGGFNSCTLAPISGSYSSSSTNSNVVRASFDYSVTASNPLP